MTGGTLFLRPDSDNLISRPGPPVKPRRTGFCLLILGLLCLPLMTGRLRAQTTELITLVSPDRPMPTVVIPENATASMIYAAEELTDYLEKITGRRPQIRDDRDPVTGAYIAVGPGRLTETLGSLALEVEEFVIDIQPERVLIAGGFRDPVLHQSGPEKGEIADPRDRGTLYGVYEFLESLGVRWYRPEPWGEIVPRLDTITLATGRAIHRPAFAIRFSMSGYRWFRAGPTPEQQEMAQRFLTRMRQNTNRWTEPKHGGYHRLNFAHAYQYLIPPDTYFQDHPEYFALIDGERSSHPAAQLCLSNPEVFEIITRQVIGSGRQGINWGVSIEPNDGSMWCECNQCQAMDDPELKTFYGYVSMSNRVFEFANQVARRVRAEVPGFKVCLLAYNRHNELPTLVTSLEPNIAVQVAAYASAASDYSRTLRDPESAANAYFLRQLEGWTELAEHVTSYEYWSGYTWSGPMPVINTMVDRLREYRRLGLAGCYNQAGDNISWGPQGLNMYLFSKLMWNPNLDLEKELDYYFEHYFGAAAEPMKAYFMIQEEAAAGGPWFGSGGSHLLHLYQQELVDQMGAYIDQAREAAAGDEQLEKRLYGVWAGYEYVRLLREMEDHKLAGRFEPALAAATELKRFFFAQEDGWVWENNQDPPNEPTDFVLRMVRETREAIENMRNFINPTVMAVLNDQWRFRRDPDGIGRSEEWFSPSFDTANWEPIRADDWWNNQGHAGYNGRAWYRRTIEVENTRDKTPILFFGAVDGDAEIWINGQYLGRHAGDVDAPGGWEEPFWFAVGDLLAEGKNEIAVEVNATIAMGGIWKGVLLLETDGVKPEAE